MNATPTKTSDGLDRAFAWLRDLGIRRDSQDRWIGGVSSGLAHRFGVDPVIVRVLFVIATIFGGVGITAYLVCLVALPDGRDTILAERAIRGGEGGPIALLVLAALSVGGMTIFDHSGWSFGWVVPAAVVAWIVLRHRRPGHDASPTPPENIAVPPATTADQTGVPQTYWSSVEAGHVGAETAGAAYAPTEPIATSPAPVPGYVHPQTRRRRRRIGGAAALMSIGFAAAAYGLGFVLDGPLGFDGSPNVLGRIFALATLGIAITIAALRGRRAGWVGIVAIILALSTIAQAKAPAFGVDAVGDRTYTPAAVPGDQSYDGGIGDVTLDLANLSTDPATVPTLSVQNGLGDIDIVIPKGLTVRVKSSNGLGEIRLNGRDAADDVIVGSGTPDVIVTATNGLGDISIEETK